MRFIPPEDLIFEWERVRAGLLEVQKGSGDDWLPEDVYLTLKAGQASLHIAEDKHGDYLGFVVLQLLPTFHGKRLHVWCAYSATSRPLMRILLAELREMATAAKAHKITFSSARNEWLGVCKRGGFEATQTTFELKL
jgi:hypothetical protein